MASDPPRRNGSLEVQVERSQGETTIRCTGELDLATSSRLEEAVEQSPDGAPVVIDCSNLAFIDSTGVRTILRAIDRLEKSSVAWRVVPGDALRRVSSALGLDAAIGLTES